MIVELFYRELGLLVPSGNPKGIKSIRDLARPKLRIINRQAGSGTRIYLDQELARARLSGKKISGYDTVVSTHLEVGLKVLGGAADVGLATRTTAQLLGLDFILSHPRAFRRRDTQRAFLRARHPGLAWNPWLS